MGPAGPEGSKVRLPTNRRAGSTWGQNWSLKRLRALKTCFEHFLIDSSHIQNRPILTLSWIPGHGEGQPLNWEVQNHQK